jgi:hypothetical protein
MPRSGPAETESPCPDRSPVSERSGVPPRSAAPSSGMAAARCWFRARGGRLTAHEAGIRRRKAPVRPPRTSLRTDRRIRAAARRHGTRIEPIEQESSGFRSAPGEARTERRTLRLRRAFRRHSCAHQQTARGAASQLVNRGGRGSCAWCRGPTQRRARSPHSCRPARSEGSTRSKRIFPGGVGGNSAAARPPDGLGMPTPVQPGARGRLSRVLLRARAAWFAHGPERGSLAGYVDRPLC